MWWVPVCLWLLVSACTQEPARPSSRPYPSPSLAGTGEVVARIGDEKITADELGKRLGSQGAAAIDRMNDPARKKLFLEEQVRFEVLAREAWEKGIHEHPDIIMELKKAMVQKYLRSTLDERADSQPIQESDLIATYQANIAEYNKPATIRLSQIVVPVSSEAERKKAHALLERVRTEVIAAEKKNKPQAFAEAAREHSKDDATRLGGGELQFMTQQELEQKYGAEVARTMFDEAKVGDMVIADASDATVLFKKTGLRNAVVRTMEMVKPQLRARIQRDRRNAAFEALFADLEKKHRVTYDLEALARAPIGAVGTATRAP